MEEKEFKKFVKKANDYYSNFHKEALKDYKEQLIGTLNKLAQVDKCTRKDFLDAIHLAEEASSVVEELEYYYDGSKVPTVQKEIEEVKEVLSLYQGVYELEEELGKLSSTVSVEDQFRKSSHDSVKKEFGKKVDSFQNHLRETGLEISVPEAPKPTRNVKERINEEEIEEYRVILKQNIEMIRNIKDQTVGEFLDAMTRTLEIENHRDELEYIYQNTNHLKTKMSVLDVYDQLETCLFAEPLVAYFDKVIPQMNIGFYLETRSENERKMIEEEISSVSASMDEKEEDFLELNEEREEISKDEVDLTPVFESFNQKMAALEAETLEEALERLEAEGKIIGESKEIVSVFPETDGKENASLEKIEVLEGEEKEESFDKVPALESFNEQISSLEAETLEETLQRLEEQGLITEVPEESLISEEPVTVVGKPKKIKVIDKYVSKFKEFLSKRQDKRYFNLVRKEYLKEIQKLQVQLDKELKSELTFQFLDQYKENYYQNQLKEIRKTLEQKYGKEIMKTLRKDSSIRMARKRITRVMKELSEGFEELLGETITRIDGTTTRLLDLTNLSEEEFHLMVQTMPVLIGTIEDNMKLVQSGRKAKRLEPKILDLNDDLFEIIEITDTIEDNKEESPSVQMEAVADVEEVESPIEKMTRALMRGANHHYRNCKKLLEMKGELVHRDDLESFSKQLRKSLESKRNLTTDSGKLWYTYKCSVEELSNSVRRLRHMSSVEVKGMIERICDQCQDFVTYFEAYQAHNKKTIAQKIQEKYASAKETFEETYTATVEVIEEIKDMKEMISHSNVLEQIKGVFSNSEAVEEEQGIDYVISESLKRDNKEEVFDTSFQFIDLEDDEIEEVAEKEELQVIPVKPSVRNLEVAEAFPELQNIGLQADQRLVNQPVVVFGVTQSNTYTPLFDLGALESQIRYLAQQNEAEVEKQDIYKKAI